LISAEKKLVNVKKAASAVTGIENAVGLDSESIVKMIDFVKRSAIDDVKQSEDTVNKDKQVLENLGYKKSSTSVEDSVALEQAKSKLTDGQSVLAEAKDRLDKISQMEMLVTGIEVAKYYAQNKASIEVEGSKRHLEELVKRNKIPQPPAPPAQSRNKRVVSSSTSTSSRRNRVPKAPKRPAIRYPDPRIVIPRRRKPSSALINELNVLNNRKH